MLPHSIILYFFIGFNKFTVQLGDTLG